MKNHTIRFALLGLAFFLFGAVQTLQAQIKTSPGTTTTTTEYSYKEAFVSTDDVAGINVIQGSIAYQVYVQKTAGSGWTLVESVKGATGDGDPNSSDIIVSYPGTHQLMVVIYSSGPGSATVYFKGN
jgi:hypothetical protein